MARQSQFAQRGHTDAYLSGLLPRDCLADEVKVLLVQGGFFFLTLSPPPLSPLAPAGAPLLFILFIFVNDEAFANLEGT